MSDFPRSHDTEDMAYWAQVGADRRDEFIAAVAPRVNLPLMKSGKDLTVGGWPAQLRSGAVPYFTAWRYGVNPQFAETYNTRDIVKRDSHTFVLFWVRFPEIFPYSGFRWTHAMDGLWAMPIDEIAWRVNRGQLPVHRYERREGSRVHATESAVIDLDRWAQLIYCEPDIELLRPLERVKFYCVDCGARVSRANKERRCGACVLKRWMT